MPKISLDRAAAEWLAREGVGSARFRAALDRALATGAWRVVVDLPGRDAAAVADALRAKAGEVGGWMAWWGSQPDDQRTWADIEEAERNEAFLVALFDAVQEVHAAA